MPRHFNDEVARPLAGIDKPIRAGELEYCVRTGPSASKGSSSTISNRREPDWETISSSPLIRPRLHALIGARGGVSPCSIKLQKRLSR
jgi:hypothetical protein